MSSNQQQQSDEEYARQLQAQELGEMGIDARTPLMAVSEHIFTNDGD